LIIQSAFLPTEDEPDGEEIGRKYTPISGIFDKGKFDVLIKTYFKDDTYPQGGLLSQYLHKMKIGEEIKIRGPFGKIVYMGDGTFEVLKVFKPMTFVKKTYKTIAMLAGGTGIAPMYQLIQAAHHAKDTVKYVLIYSNKSQADILLREELEAFANTKNFDFTLVHTLTRENPDSGWTGERGRINEEMIKKYVPPPSYDVIILTCGTVEMTQKFLVPLTKKMGYKEDNILDF